MWTGGALLRGGVPPFAVNTRIQKHPHQRTSFTVTRPLAKRRRQRQPNHIMPTKRRTHTSLRATPSARLSRYAGIIGYQPVWNGTSIYLHPDAPADGLYISPSPLARITVGGLPVTAAYNNGSGQIVVDPDPTITPSPAAQITIVISATPPSISDRTGRILQPGPRIIAGGGDAWTPSVNGGGATLEATITAPDNSPMMISPQAVNAQNIGAFEVTRISDAAWYVTVQPQALGDWSITMGGAYTATLGPCGAFTISGRLEML